MASPEDGLFEDACTDVFTSPTHLPLGGLLFREAGQIVKGTVVFSVSYACMVLLRLRAAATTPASLHAHW